MRTIERNTIGTRVIGNKIRGKIKVKPIPGHWNKLKKSLGWLKTDIDAATWEREIRGNWN